MDYHLGESANPMTHSHQLNWFKYKNQLNLVKNFELYGVYNLSITLCSHFVKVKFQSTLLLYFNQTGF